MEHLECSAVINLAFYKRKKFDIADTDVRPPLLLWCSSRLMHRARHRSELLLLLAGVHAQYPARETAAALRWWCEPSRGHEAGALCMRAAMTEVQASLLLPPLAVPALKPAASPTAALAGKAFF